jgi:archaemetzincin
MKKAGPRKKFSRGAGRAFEPGEDFEPVPEPGPHDWLSVHHEPGQSFAEYVKSGPFIPGRGHDVLYIQPVGDFHEHKSPSIYALEEFAAAFFCMETREKKAVSLVDYRLTTRINPYTGKRQVLTLDVLSLLLQNPASDAYCTLAVTMEDLYPDPSWNFVFGQAYITERVGVFSFSRYDPLLYGTQGTPEGEKPLLYRSCKVLAHETGHMFGLLHCIDHHCLMNGSNHLEESDRRPLYLCPVCLRKLYHATGFEIRDRYLDLLRFYEKEGFLNEAGWIEKRLRHIS